MSLDNIILKLKREFTGNEKYRLFLHHLNNIEHELSVERKRNTELIKSSDASNQEIKELKKQIIELKMRIDEYDISNIGKTCVKFSTHDKMVKSRDAYRKRYWDAYNKLKENNIAI